MSPRLHITLHEIVAERLWADDPPETRLTAQRLSAVGYDRHVVLYMLTSKLSDELHHALQPRAEVRRVRVHDLRHTVASFLLLQGVDMRVVMGTLGHSRLATTSDLYTHLLEPVQRAAADRMDDLLRQGLRSLITAVAVRGR